MEKNVKVHCLTNPVTMQSVANVLLAAGGSAVMAQDEQEVEEITAICQATLLNTGVPDERKIRSCILAGKCANRLGHPVVLDPVGAGASKFRRKKIGQLLQSVVPSIIRCNQEEASALLRAEDEKEFLVLGTERQKIEGTYHDENLHIWCRGCPGAVAAAGHLLPLEKQFRCGDPASG